VLSCQFRELNAYFLSKRFASCLRNGSLECRQATYFARSQSKLPGRRTRYVPNTRYFVGEELSYRGTALAAAVESKTNPYVDNSERLKVIYYLLENGASAKCSAGTDTRCSGNHDYSMPLDLAIKYNESDLITLLMENGAEFCPNSVKEAASGGYEEMVKSIIECGVSVNKTGYSPLMAAIDEGNDPIIQMLLEAGADVSAQIGGKWNYGCPLGHAIEKGNTRLVEQLISLGADVNGRVGVFGTALRHAAHHGDLEAVAILLRNGADVNASTDDFRSPLASAVTSANEILIRQLLDAGADVNIDGGEPLLIAAGTGKMHIVKLLLESGAELHIQQGIPERALQRAASFARKDICEFFIEQGADVNAQGGDDG
jgi:ankyrin repeat protein